MIYDKQCTFKVENARLGVDLEFDIDFVVLANGPIED